MVFFDSFEPSIALPVERYAIYFKTLAVELLIGFYHIGVFGATRATPSRPEVNQYIFATHRRELHDIAIFVGQTDFRCQAAYCRERKPIYFGNEVFGEIFLTAFFLQSSSNLLKKVVVGSICPSSAIIDEYRRGSRFLADKVIDIFLHFFLSALVFGKDFFHFSLVIAALGLYVACFQRFHIFLESFFFLEIAVKYLSPRRARNSRLAFGLHVKKYIDLFFRLSGKNHIFFAIKIQNIQVRRLVAYIYLKLAFVVYLEAVNRNQLLTFIIKIIDNHRLRYIGRRYFSFDRKRSVGFLLCLGKHACQEQRREEITKHRKRF